MSERVLKLFEMVSNKGSTYRVSILNAKNHEIQLWRITPGEWIPTYTSPL